MADRDAIKAALIETLSSPEGAGADLEIFEHLEDGGVLLKGRLDLEHLTTDVEVRVAAVDEEAHAEGIDDGLEKAAALLEYLDAACGDPRKKSAYRSSAAAIRGLKGDLGA